MAADVLDSTNGQINDFLLDIRDQLREAVNSGKYADWEGRAIIQPRKIFEFASGNLYKKRLTSTSHKA